VAAGAGPGLRRDQGQQVNRSAGVLVLGLAVLATPGASAAPLRLPPVLRARLSNGLRVFVVATNRVPLVDLRLVVRAGSVDDPTARGGWPGRPADLLDQGAGARSAKQIAEDIDFVGGLLEPDADLERTVVDCQVLKKDFDTGLFVLRDVVVSPRFGAEEV